MVPTKQKPTGSGRALGTAGTGAAAPQPKGNPGAVGDRGDPRACHDSSTQPRTPREEDKTPGSAAPLSPPPARTPRRRSRGASLRTQSAQGAAAQPAGRPPRAPARTGLVVQRDLDVGDVAEGDEGGVQHLLVHLLRQPACGRHRVSAETPPMPPQDPPRLPQPQTTSDRTPRGAPQPHAPTYSTRLVAAIFPAPPRNPEAAPPQRGAAAAISRQRGSSAASPSTRSGPRPGTGE